MRGQYGDRHLGGRTVQGHHVARNIGNRVTSFATAEVNEVGESERITVEKGAKTETDQSPLRIIACKPTIN